VATGGRGIHPSILANVFATTAMIAAQSLGGAVAKCGSYQMLGCRPMGFEGNLCPCCQGQGGTSNGDEQRGSAHALAWRWENELARSPEEAGDIEISSERSLFWSVPC
jgi:hypothetical protein